jgi:hypothetical protein
MFHRTLSPVGSADTRSARAVKASRRLTGLALALALSPASLWGATNLVPNPRFDGGIAGWTNFDNFTATFSGSDLDETGKSESGSLRVSGIPLQWLGSLKSDCFPVTPGENVVFGFSTFAPGSAGGHEAVAKMIFFRDASCTLGTAVVLDSDLRAIWPATTWRPVQGHGTVPADTVAARLILTVASYASPPEELYIDNAFTYEGKTCAATAQVVCLGGDHRFRVDARWRIPNGDRGHAWLRTFSSDSSYGTFFDAANVELVVKVLDACAYNNRFWIFAAGLTNVEVELTVADTYSDETWSRTNPLNHAFAPIQDTNALATCPH